MVPALVKRPAARDHAINHNFRKFAENCLVAPLVLTNVNLDGAEIWGRSNGQGFGVWRWLWVCPSPIRQLRWICVQCRRMKRWQTPPGHNSHSRVTFVSGRACLLNRTEGRGRQDQTRWLHQCGACKEAVI